MTEKIETTDRSKRLAEEIACQVSDLANDYMPGIEAAGLNSDKGEAKVSFAVSFEAVSDNPNVKTRISFSSTTKDETERQISINQMEIQFPENENT